MVRNCIVLLRWSNHIARKFVLLCTNLEGVTSLLRFFCCLFWPRWRPELLLEASEVEAGLSGSKCTRFTCSSNLEGSRHLWSHKGQFRRGSFCDEGWSAQRELCLSTVYIMGTHKYAESFLKSLFLISIVVCGNSKYIELALTTIWLWGI